MGHDRNLLQTQACGRWLPDVVEECRPYVWWNGRFPTTTSTSTAAHARTARTSGARAHHGWLRSGALVGGGPCDAPSDERVDAERDSGTLDISASPYYGTSHCWGWAMVQRRVLRQPPVRQAHVFRQSPQEEAVFTGLYRLSTLRATREQARKTTRRHLATMQASVGESGRTGLMGTRRYAARWEGRSAERRVIRCHKHLIAFHAARGVGKT